MCMCVHGILIPNYPNHAITKRSGNRFPIGKSILCYEYELEWVFRVREETNNKIFSRSSTKANVFISMSNYPELYCLHFSMQLSLLRRTEKSLKTNIIKTGVK